MGNTDLALDSDQLSLSEVSRIANVFTSPSRTFRDLNRKKSWLLAWLLISIVWVWSVWVMDTKIGFDQISAYQMRMTPMGATPDSRRVGEIGSFTRVIAYSGPILFVVEESIIALVLMASLNGATGSRVRFGTSLAVTVYSSLPETIKRAIIGLRVLLGVNPETFNVRNPIVSNPAFLVSQPEHRVLYKLLSSFDVFTMWTLILMSIGYACISNVRQRTAFLVVFGWYGLLTLCLLGFARLFS